MFWNFSSFRRTSGICVIAIAAIIANSLDMSAPFAIDSGYGALHIFLEKNGEQTRYQLDFLQEGVERFFEHVILDNGVQSGYIAKGAEMSKEFAKIAATAITHIPEVLLKEGNFQNREFYLERIPDRSL